VADVHDKEARSRNMAAIKSRNSKPELFIRRGLHALGFRFRLHDRGLPGTPDLVFPRHKAVVFVHGCFWHRHDCHLFKWPQTRKEFWEQKIGRNAQNDEAALAELRARGWRVAVVWECALKGPGRLDRQQAIWSLATWIRSDRVSLEVRGKDDWSKVSRSSSD
jgi:DNA mismatch endonuclease (patch repair protein)